MALLRLSNGRIYTGITTINTIVAPLQIGTFEYPQNVRKAVAGFQHPLAQRDAMFILESLDPKAVDMVISAGFTHRRVGNVVPSRADDGSFAFVQRDESSPGDAPARERSPQEIREYLIPHYVQVNDWHFVFSGAIVKGLVIRPDLQGVVYCEPGEWIRLNPKLLNWPIFPYGEPTAAVSYFDRPFEVGPFKMDLHPEVEVLPGMNY